MKRRKIHKRRDYTIRGLPDRVIRALRDRAHRENRSINEVAIEALQLGLGLPEPERIHDDLDHLISTWVEDSEFDRAIEDQDRMDPSLWQR